MSGPKDYDHFVPCPDRGSNPERRWRENCLPCAEEYVAVVFPWFVKGFYRYWKYVRQQSRGHNKANGGNVSPSFRGWKWLACNHVALSFEETIRPKWLADINPTQTHVRNVEHPFRAVFFLFYRLFVQLVL